MEEKKSSQKEVKRKKIVEALNRKISYLRFFVYLLLTISVFLSAYVVLWTQYVYEDSAIDIYYSKPPKTPKAFFYMSPKAGNYKVGEEFDVDVLINTSGSHVVAATAYVSYNKNQMEALSVNLSDSVFNITFEEKIIPIEGKVKISMGKPTPGINEFDGKMATIRFKALQPVNPKGENVYFDFTKGSSLFSAIILDDKLGTNILNDTRGAEIKIGNN